ncbi:hypothetical protein [Parasitella parasitica]|uniref:CCHC-type domain-containing protein n=1 Tax=Parasitella parasitica TaxID=35722 RepID=A0A0B7N7X9_9FUNG|nr:hypothetical protein [Parasitella parasitica]
MPEARVRSTSNVLVCPSCGKEGHQRRSHSDCDNNPNNQASISIDAEEAAEYVNMDTVNSSAETVTPEIHTSNTPRVVCSACGREGHRQRTHIDCEHNLSCRSNQLSIARDPSLPEVDRNELGEMIFTCVACGAYIKTRPAAPPLSVDMRNSTNNIAIGGNIHAVLKRQRDNNGEDPSTKRGCQEKEEEQEEEEDNEEDPRSDLEGYDGDDDEEDDDEWMIGSYSISKVLEGFRDMSMKTPPSNVSDLGLLAINNIYLFTLARDESVLKYFDVYSEDDEYDENAELLCDEI